MGQTSTEVGGSEILTWSAHHCNMQQQQVSETALLESRAKTNSGVLRLHMQIPEAECRICGGTGCVFCGTCGGSLEVGAHYRKRAEERDAIYHARRQQRRIDVLLPTKKDPELESVAVLGWKNMFSRVYKALKKTPAEQFIRCQLATKFGFDGQAVEEIRCKYCDKRINVQLPIGGHIITKYWVQHRDSNRRCLEKQRSMRISPVAVAWRRKHLIDENLVDLFVAVFHPSRLWGSETGYDTLDITCKFHKWVDFCLEAEDSEGIEARLRRIDRLLDALELKSAATKRAEWKATFWRTEEEELYVNMTMLYNKPPGIF